jgi:hypothetical protein
MKTGIALVLTSALVVAALPVGVHAGATPHMIFASVGIARGQLARLNISNINNADLLDTTGELPAGPCLVTLGFVDGNNQMLVPAVRVSLGGSRSTRLEVNLDSPELRRLPGVQGNRGSVQVRAVVGFPGATEGACGSIIGGVEIVDSQTGATTAIQNPLVYTGFDPQPDQRVGGPSGQ